MDESSFLALLVRDCGQTERETNWEIFKMLDWMHLKQVIDHWLNLTVEYKYDFRWTQRGIVMQVAHMCTHASGINSLPC